MCVWVYVRVGVCVGVCVYVYVRVWAYACVCVYVRECGKFVYISNRSSRVSVHTGEGWDLSLRLQFLLQHVLLFESRSFSFCTGSEERDFHFVPSF